MPGRDAKKEMKGLYSGRAGRVVEVDVPRLTYLMLDGKGDPSTSMGAAIGALYAVAYPLKFAIRKRDPTLDYVVMPPEATYHGESAEAFAGTPKDEWRWTVMVLQPVRATAAELREAKARAVEKGLALAADVRQETREEGHCVQVMHLGPYAKEHETIARMHGYAAEHGLRPSGPHHEIYLGDPNRTAPEKLKTLLRQPVALRAS